MGIRQIDIQIDGITHTIQVNDDDKNAPHYGRVPVEVKEAPAPANKARAPRNKAAKVADKSVEDASDPDASE